MEQMLWLKAALGSLFACSLHFLGIPEKGMIILLILFVIDFTTGILKAKRIAGGDAITSKRWKEGFISKLHILCVLLAVALGLKGVGFESEIPIDIILGMFIASETYSIIQNAYSYFTGKKVTEYVAFVKVLEIIGDIFKTKIQK